MFKHIKKQKGQSTVEYIVLVTAVVAVLLLFLANGNSPFNQKLNSTLNTVTGKLPGMTTLLTNSN